MQTNLSCAVLVLGLTHSYTAGADNSASRNPDPDQPYRAKKSNPVTYDVSFSAVVTPPAHTKVLKVWMPLPQSDAGQEVEEGDLDTFPMRVEPKVAEEQPIRRTDHRSHGWPRATRLLRAIENGIAY